MVKYVIPGAAGSAEHNATLGSRERSAYGRPRVVVSAQAPVAFGTLGDSSNEVQRLKSRFPAPASTAADTQRYKSAKERLDLEGYQSDNWVLPGYHEYTVETVICKAGQEGCTEEAVFEQLRRFPAPQRFGAPDRQVGVKTGDRSFALGVGMVEHWVGTRLLTNSTLPYRHLLNPGVVIREVVTVDGSIIVKTSGFGSGLLPQINSGIAAKLIWSDRTDSKIIEAIRNKGKK
jgi:hypothetical protein